MRQGRLFWGRWAVALAAATTAVLVAPAAHAAWSSPFNVSPATQSGFNPKVAVDDDGDAVFVWKDNLTGQIQARARSATGTLSAVQTLSGAAQAAFDPQVAVDADGDAVFTWERSDGDFLRIQARARSAAGALSAVQNLSSPGRHAQDPQVAVDVSGDAVFAWNRFDGLDERVQGVARSSAGVLSAVQTLSAAGESASAAQVAVDSSGDAVFAWHRLDGTAFRVQARARSSAGALSGVQTLSPTAGAGAFFPDVAIGGSGDAVFTWTRYDGSFDRVQGRTRSAAGVLTPVETLSAAGENAAEPQVAIDDGGDAVFAWHRFDGTNDRVQIRERTAGGTLSSVQNLSPAGEDAQDAQVAVDTDGDGVVIWRNLAGLIQARTNSAHSVLGPVRTFSDSGSVADPQVAVDADGDAIATWRFFLAGNWRVRAAVGP